MHLCARAHTHTHTQRERERETLPQYGALLSLHWRAVTLPLWKNSTITWVAKFATQVSYFKTRGRSPYVGDFEGSTIPRNYHQTDQQGKAWLDAQYSGNCLQLLTRPAYHLEVPSDVMVRRWSQDCTSLGLLCSCIGCCLNLSLGADRTSCKFLLSPIAPLSEQRFARDTAIHVQR